MSRIRPTARPRGGTPPSRKGMAAPWGFTVIELMVAVAILAVLATLAAPSFTPLLERWRVRQTLESLQSTLYYARSEAIRRGGGVAIQKLPNTNGCTLAANSDDWGCGWVVFVDANGNNQWDAGEEIQRLDTQARVLVTRSTSSAIIRLDRWGGMAGLSAIGFTIAPHPRGINSPATRGLCVAAGGRIKVIDKGQVPC